MWPRYCELIFAVWLIASGWLLENPDPGPYRAVAVAAGVLTVALDLLSITFVKPYAYLGVLGVGAGLLGYAYFAAPAEAQGTQNAIIVALLLLMFAILPTEASLPPRSWRDLRGRS